MFVVTEAEAAAIRAVYEQRGGGAWHLQKSRCLPPIAPAAEAMKAPTNIEKNR